MMKSLRDATCYQSNFEFLNVGFDWKNFVIAGSVSTFSKLGAGNGLVSGRRDMYRLSLDKPGEKPAEVRVVETSTVEPRLKTTLSIKTIKVHPK